jgi:hypothetical protein
VGYIPGFCAAAVSSIPLPTPGENPSQTGCATCRRFFSQYKVAARQRYILTVLLPEDDPFQPTPGRTGQMEEFSNFAPPGVLIAKLIAESAKFEAEQPTKSTD